MTALLALVLAASPPKSVYRLRPAADAAVIAASLGLSAAADVLGPRLVVERCPCDPRELPGFDRFAVGLHSGAAATASDWTIWLAFAAPPVADAALLGFSRPLLEDVVVFGEALSVDAFLTTVAKYAVQRPLPLTYAGNAGLERSQYGYRSFFSGHTSSAFAALGAAAMTARLRYGERWWPWAAAAVVGTGVGVERVLAGRHFPSDVVAGAAVGLGVGIAVPWLHERGDVTLTAGARGVGLAGRF